MGGHIAAAKTFAKMRVNAYILFTHQRYPAPMNAHDDLTMKTEEVLRVELEVFKREHADLNEAIDALQAEGKADMLTLQRLKRKKLQLKDRMRAIEDRLTPDIIA